MDGNYIYKTKILLIILFMGIAAQNQRNYYIDFTHTHAVHNSSIYVKEWKCWLRPLELDNRTKNVFDCDFRFAESIKAFDIWGIINGYPKNMRRLTILNTQLNGCNAFEILHRHKILRIFAKTFLKYFNVETLRCPLQKDFNYTLRGFRYDPSDFPSYVPEGEFEGILRIIIDNKIVASVSLKGFVKYYRNSKMV